MVKDYFDRLEKELDGISPKNIYNMDETGFHDDPGKKGLLFRRSTHHPDLSQNFTKSCYTVVFCGNAAEEFIPPFFILKSYSMPQNCLNWLCQNLLGLILTFFKSS